LTTENDAVFDKDCHQDQVPRDRPRRGAATLVTMRDGAHDLNLAVHRSAQRRHANVCSQQGLTPIVPTKSRTRTAPRRLSPRQGPEARRIERILDTPEGQALYRRRQQIVEPVFAHTKILRRIDRFQRRGLAACAAEWKLIAATHNLLKLWRLAPAAITA
jgi:hypothetical protein